MLEDYISVIGLEVHSQLLTNSKAFCTCSTEFGTRSMRSKEMAYDYRYFPEPDLVKVSNSGLFEEIIKNVINSSPESIEKYKSGRTNVLGFLLGQAMKETKGKGNPQMLTEIAKKLLDKL
jgi:Asp-tRNA(Asn)/Glu-tRNA(Gln) amidotransferase B subunit